MDKSKMTEHIKVNLPLTEQDYLSGNGEGVWMLVDRETKMAHDIDAVGGRYVGILDNDSVYYPGLNAGAEIIFEMRGGRYTGRHSGRTHSVNACGKSGRSAKDRRAAGSRGGCLTPYRLAVPSGQISDQSTK